jgi:hypothetical protein
MHRRDPTIDDLGCSCVADEKLANALDHLVLTRRSNVPTIRIPARSCMLFNPDPPLRRSFSRIVPVFLIREVGASWR